MHPNLTCIISCNVPQSAPQGDATRAAAHAYATDSGLLMGEPQQGYAILRKTVREAAATLSGDVKYR